MLESFCTLFHAALIAPFAQYAFMQKALLGCIALSLGCGSIGSFLVLRRMSLVADALSHGLFPGVCVAFLCAGFHMFYLSLGGAITGIVLGCAAYGVSCKTISSKDSTFAILVLFSLALGLFILTVFGGYTDVMHILVGNVLVISESTLLGMGLVATMTLLALVLFYRPFVLKAFDPQFFRSAYGPCFWIDALFLVLLTLNIVCSFQALGSLMAMGLLLIPAITARLWAKQIATLCFSATLLGILASVIGLLIAYHAAYPVGPVIILVSLAFYVLGLLGTYLSGTFSKVCLIGVLLIGGFFSAQTFWQQRHEKPQIVVSFTVLQDFVRQLSGDLFVVKTLVGPNRDPHTFEPSPQDMIDLFGADLVIINGLHLENHWLKPFLAHYKKDNLVVASRHCTPRFFTEGTQKIPDPHAWHNVAYAQKYVSVIEAALTKRFPRHADLIHKRAAAYQKKLQALDTWVMAHIRAMPAHKRCAITTHDGFGYFEEAYGFSFLTPVGPSTEAEPTPQQLSKILDAAKEKKVTAVFFENMVSQHTMKMLAREGNLKIGGTLYSDALSDETGPAITYVTMVEHNVLMLLKSLKA
ncbi:MAG: metal ABC transporter solute-binding protein, Zn/Mn family [Holosporaceae bacterium]